MMARTTDEKRLRRLAAAYAVAYAAVAVNGLDHDVGYQRRFALDAEYAKARDRLWEEFRRLTVVDMTPRAVAEGY